MEKMVLDVLQSAVSVLEVMNQAGNKRRNRIEGSRVLAARRFRTDNALPNKTPRRSFLLRMRLDSLLTDIYNIDKAWQFRCREPRKDST